MPSVQRFLERLRRAASRRPAVPTPTASEPLPPNPPGPEPTDPPKRHIAVVVEGLAGEDLERVFDIIWDQSAARGLKPVIITMTADLQRIRARKWPVEIVLDIHRQRLDDLPMELRLEQQLQGIVRLWQPAVITSFASFNAAHLAQRLRALAGLTEAPQ